MFFRAIAAVAALVVSLASPALAEVSPSIQSAELTTVEIRAHIHVHYFTDAERAKLPGNQGESTWYYLTSKPKTKTEKSQPSDAQPDEDYYDTIVCSGYVATSDGVTDTIVTARHCTQPNIEGFLGIPLDEVTLTPTRVVLLDGRTYPVSNIIRSTDSDLALLEVKTNTLDPSAPFDTTPLKRGDALEILGMPNARPFYLSTAFSSMGTYETTVESDTAQFAGLEVIECASCYSGDSGAGVYNASGSVVGILDAGGDQPGTAAIVPAYRIRELLTNHE